MRKERIPTYADDFFVCDPEYKSYHDNILDNKLHYMQYEFNVPKGFYLLHFLNDTDALRFAAKRLDITRVVNQITRQLLYYKNKKEQKEFMKVLCHLSVGILQ